MSTDEYTNLGYVADPIAVEKRLVAYFKAYHASYEDRGTFRHLLGSTFWQRDDISDTYGMTPAGLMAFVPAKRSDEANYVRIQLTQQPFTVFGTGLDKTANTHVIVLAFVDDKGNSRKIALPRDVLAKGDAAMASHLEAQGFRLGGEPRANRLLREVLTKLRGPDVEVVPNPGWHGSGREMMFVHPLGTFGKTEKRVFYDTARFNQLKVGLKGSHESWIENVAKPAKGNSRLIFALSLAVTSPLIRFTTGVENRMFTLWGPSSKGKSSIQIVAGSVHGGDPNDKLGFAHAWNATPNALPVWAATHSHLFGALDEMPTDREKSGELVQFAYNLSGGVDKQRLNKDAVAKVPVKWQLFALASAEKPLSEMAEADAARRGHLPEGQQARVIDVPAVVSDQYGAFDTLHDADSAAEFADRLKDSARRDFGHAGVKFVKRLIKYVNDRGEDGFSTEVSELMQEFEDHLDLEGTASIVRRVAKSFALVYAAGVLAWQCNVFGDAFDLDDILAACKACFDDWLKQRGGGHSHAKAYPLNRLRSFLEEQTSRFVYNGQNAVQMGMNGDASRVAKLAGYQDENYFYVHISVFNSEIAGGKEAARSLANRLDELGLLRTQESEKKHGRLQVQLTKPTKSRVYAVSKRILEVDEQGELDFTQSSEPTPNRKAMH